MSKVFQMIGGSGGGIKLASIEITTPPTKTAYKAGEQFSTAGMVVKATYSNGAMLIATGVSVEPSGGLEAGRTSVTIRYTEGGGRLLTYAGPHERPGLLGRIALNLVHRRPLQKEGLQNHDLNGG